jgi:cysteinyl-tRNA synthetase
MAALVVRIAEYARERAGSTFVICPQNGLALLDDASADARSSYLAAIDALAVESLYFNHASDGDQAYRLAKLAEAGKKALVLEYVSEAQWPELFSRVATSGLDMISYPAAPDRLLDELILVP